MRTSNPDISVEVLVKPDKKIGKRVRKMCKTPCVATLRLLSENYQFSTEATNALTHIVSDGEFVLMGRTPADIKDHDSWTLIRESG